MHSKLAQNTLKWHENVQFSVCVMMEKSQQVNYLIDEAENPGNGAGLVHHYLGKYGYKERAIYLHADNCTAQNKNNTTIQYMMWRVMTDKNESIDLSFILMFTHLLPV